VLVGSKAGRFCVVERDERSQPAEESSSMFDGRLLIKTLVAEIDLVEPRA